MVTLSSPCCWSRGRPKIRLVSILSSSRRNRCLLLTQLTLIQIISGSCINIWSPTRFRIDLVSNFNFDFLNRNYSFFTHLTISCWRRKHRLEFVDTFLWLKNNTLILRNGWSCYSLTIPWGILLIFLIKISRRRFNDLIHIQFSHLNILLLSFRHVQIWLLASVEIILLLKNSLLVEVMLFLPIDKSSLFNHLLHLIGYSHCLFVLQRFSLLVILNVRRIVALLDSKGRSGLTTGSYDAFNTTNIVWRRLQLILYLL